ncbi:MAG: 3'(2'),5'-bisphosphate nucleotidase CysQ [Cyclobacteriaceae bacterium]|nr:3'(2'),5'-bisphosphate nucleotidase CysQ [Cyclobacteriaceae bacterium]
MDIDIDRIKKTAIAAGEEILQIYHDTSRAQEVDYKSDQSPLTLADQASNELIVSSLSEFFPDIPILSEEGKSISYEERKHWDTFWLVDPLDGTKEFIKRNGEFTVNIALIEDGFPTFGVIYAPVMDHLYIGDGRGKKAWWIDENQVKSPLQVRQKTSDRVAVGSRTHSSTEEAELLQKYDVIETMSVGSSLKFCMVASGKADIYYRHGPTMEWDTAAGQAIVEAAGGAVLNMGSGKRFGYNKENLLNGSFLVLGF